MLIVCVVIFIGVFGVMFYSIFKHRKSKGHKAANFHESTTVEIVWTIVPFLIVILMALPATKAVVAMKDTSSADLTIKVTGIQWKWGYDYLKGEGEGIGFVSTLDPAQREMSDSGKPSGDDYLLKVDNPMVVPVNKKVRVITTADDVIHAFYVPALGVQEDGDPGLRPRHLVPRREGRHLLRPMHPALRQGARLHADQHQGGLGAGLHRVGRRQAQASRSGGEVNRRQ